LAPLCGSRATAVAFDGVGGNGWGNEIVVKNLTAVDGRGRTDARGVRRTRHLLVIWTALSNTRRAQKPRLPGSRVTAVAACFSSEK